MSSWTLGLVVIFGGGYYQWEDPSGTTAGGDPTHYQRLPGSQGLWDK